VVADVLNRCSKSACSPQLARRATFLLRGMPLQDASFLLDSRSGRDTQAPSTVLQWSAPLQDMVTVHVCSSASLNLHVYQGQSQSLTDNVQSPISSRKTVTTFNNNSTSPCDQHRHAPTDSLHLVHLWKSRSAVV
jgi:hypothetical protein